MRRHGITVIVAIAFCLAAATSMAATKKDLKWSANVMTAQAATAKLQKMYTAAELQKGVYIGSDFCLACHSGMSSYRDTNHASFLRRPLEKWSLVPGKGVIADYDNNGVDDFRQQLDFNTIASAFDKYKPNAPKLSVESGTYYVTIGSMKMPLVFTVAGQRNGSAQRYVVRVPVTDTATKMSTAVYFAPIQYAPATGWAAYSPAAWYDAANGPKFSAGISSASLVATGGPSSHTGNCVACHSTGIAGLSKTATGEVNAQLYTAVLLQADDPTLFDYNNDGQIELMNIGCEDCHGAGSWHILGAGDKTKIVNPATLKPAEQAEICGRCHVTAKSVPTGLYSYPYNEATNTFWTPTDRKNGVPLSQYYQTMPGAPNMWPDGITPNGGRPYNQYAISNHATFAPHVVGCPECHDPHHEGEGMLIREEMDISATQTVKTAVEDNTLCLSCHATHGPFASFTKQELAEALTGKAEAGAKIANAVSAHTKHPYAPTRMMGLSRCVDCHMTAAGGHTFKAISPADTVKYADKGGMANSCASGCHQNRVDIFNFGVKGTGTTYGTAFDVKLAKELAKYFGEDGIWWNTKK